MEESNKQEGKTQEKSWIKKHPVWSGIIGLIILFFVIGMFSPNEETESETIKEHQCADNTFVSNPKDCPKVDDEVEEESDKPLTNLEYLTEISPTLDGMQSISESISGTIDALIEGLIDLEKFEDNIDNLWYESYQNSEQLKEIIPPTDCEDAHFYLKEMSAGQFLALDELSSYCNYYKESHITSATTYLSRVIENTINFTTELETNCII